MVNSHCAPGGRASVYFHVSSMLHVSVHYGQPSRGFSLIGSAAAQRLQSFRMETLESPNRTKLKLFLHPQWERSCSSTSAPPAGDRRSHHMLNGSTVRFSMGLSPSLILILLWLVPNTTDYCLLTQKCSFYVSYHVFSLFRIYNKSKLSLTVLINHENNCLFIVFLPKI